MNEIIDRINRIKQYLDDDNNDDDLINKKERNSKQLNISSIKNKTPEKGKLSNKSLTPNKTKISSKNKTTIKSKTPNKDQIIQKQKQVKYNEPKPISEPEINMSNQTDGVNINDIKEMQQRLQSHLVNLTKIIIKNKLIKSISQDISLEMKNRSPYSKSHQKSEEETIRKKDQKNQLDQIEKSSSNLIDDSIPLPIDFSNQRVYSSSSSFLIHEKDFPNHHPKNNSTFSLQKFMNSNAAHSILKNSNYSNETNSNFDSKPDLRTSDLNSINSLIEEAKKVRQSKKTHFSSEDDRIPGETLLISSENNENFSVNTNESDILGIPFIPENYSGDNEINNQADFITFSISSDGTHNKEDINENFHDVEISAELKARYLDPTDNTKIASFSAFESPILKGAKILDFGEDIDMNNLYDIRSDEGYQVSLEDY